MTSPESRSTANDIRLRLDADRTQGGIKDLSEYLLAFPKCETLVAREWLSASTEASGRNHAPVPGSFGEGRYLISGEIGQGGQGSVLVARDTKLDRDVAIKVLSSTAPFSPRAVDRFRREALLASKLDHPGICPVFDAGEDNGVLYLVMRLVHGRTLARYIVDSNAAISGSDETSIFIDLTGEDDPDSDESIAIDEGQGPKTTDPQQLTKLLKFIEKAARALHYAHQMGVIHRDVKPANIMVSEDREPVILDFGLARDENEESTDISLVGEVFGTPAYMSPEQLEEDVEVDHRTDIYSLGATLYEAITAQRLFEAPTRRALFDSILRVQPRRIGRVVDGISKDLEIVVHTAIEKDRDLRYQTAEDFADEIRRVIGHEPILARPPGPITRMRLWYRRDPKTALAVAAAFLILFVGAITSSIFAGAANRERRRADTENLEYRRLADSRRVAELRAEARDELWPPRESNREAFRDWLRRADQLLDRLPKHEAALKDLRRQGHLATESEETQRLSELDLRRDRLLAELKSIEEQFEAAEKTETPNTVLVQELESRRADLQEGIRDLDDASARQVWIFESADLGWRHGRLAELVSELRALQEADIHDTSGHASVSRRLEVAESLERLSIDNHAAAWEKTIRDIEKEPIYRGLRIKPQVGLIPLGFNKKGLAEFAHFASGEIPERTPEGRLTIDEDSAIVLVLIPGGRFLMGSPDTEPGRREDEQQHSVELAPYFIGKYEVTQGQWKRVMGENTAHFRPGNDERGLVGDQVVSFLHPIERVDWNECMDFCRRADLLLPTEARWEMACRAGSKESFTWGDDPYCLQDRSNLGDESIHILGDQYRNLSQVPWNDGWTIHAPVNAGAENTFGLYGLHGNVAEWCFDRYSASFPTGIDLPPDGENLLGWKPARTFRGGNWMNSAGSARTALRWEVRAEHRLFNLGMRAARNVE